MEKDTLQDFQDVGIAEIESFRRIVENFNKAENDFIFEWDTEEYKRKRMEEEQHEIDESDDIEDIGWIDKIECNINTEELTDGEYYNGEFDKQ